MLLKFRPEKAQVVRAKNEPARRLGQAAMNYYLQSRKKRLNIERNLKIPIPATSRELAGAALKELLVDGSQEIIRRNFVLSQGSGSTSY